MFITIKQTPSNFLECLTNCFGYVVECECDDPETTQGYMTELTEITIAFHTEDISVAWGKLIDSGVFHDSEGKVIEVGDDYVKVTTEY